MSEAPLYMHLMHWEECVFIPGVLFPGHFAVSGRDAVRLFVEKGIKF